MSNAPANFQSFIIPSPKNRFHRRSFYGLQRRFKEPIEKWFKRLENRFNLCGFDELAEHMLLDKFFSELDDGEIDAIRSEGHAWSLKQLQRYLRTEKVCVPNGTVDGKIGTSEMNTVYVAMDAASGPIKMEYEDSDDHDDSNMINYGDEDETLAHTQCDESQFSETYAHVKPSSSKQQRLYICDVCSKVCKNSFNMKQHLITHTDEKPYACEFCTYRCNTSSNLNAHKKRVHKWKRQQ